MILFALLGIPAFAFAAYSLERALAPGASPAKPAAAEPVRSPWWHLLWGVLYAVPCHWLARLLGRLFPESYRPFLLYLNVLGRDHLFQAGLLGLALFTFLRDSGFRKLAFFAAGYFSLLGLWAALAGRGMQDAYELFLLPSLRMSALVLLPYLFARFREESGLRAGLDLALFVLLPLAGAATGYLYARSWPFWAGACALGLFAAALACLPFLRDTR